MRCLVTNVRTTMHRPGEGGQVELRLDTWLHYLHQAAAGLMGGVAGPDYGKEVNNDNVLHFDLMPEGRETAVSGIEAGLEKLVEKWQVEIAYSSGNELPVKITVTLILGSFVEFHNGTRDTPPVLFGIQSPRQCVESINEWENQPEKFRAFIEDQLNEGLAAE